MSIGFPSSADDSLYYTRYLKLATGDDLIQSLEDIRNETLGLVGSLSTKDLNFSYAEGKWTIGVLLKHICDAERVYAYRALRMLRGDATDLPGFDENEFAQRSLGYQTIEAFTTEYQAVRSSSVSLFLTSDWNNLDFEGRANGLVFTPRILGWLMIGHNRHHLEVLRERYLPHLESA